MALPSPNIFIPEDFSLKTDSNELITSETPWNFFLKHNSLFNQPKCELRVYFHLTSFDVNKEDLTFKLDILSNILKADLTKQLYDASLAGTEYALDFSIEKVYIKVSGFSDTIHEVFQVILEKFRTVEISDTAFKSATDSIKQKYLAFQSKMVYQIAEVVFNEASYKGLTFDRNMFSLARFFRIFEEFRLNTI